MLTWNSLTKSQKRWVEHVSKVLPECLSKGYITATQCYDSFKELEKQMNQVVLMKQLLLEDWCIL